MFKLLRLANKTLVRPTLCALALKTFCALVASLFLKLREELSELQNDKLVTSYLGFSNLSKLSCVEILPWINVDFLKLANLNEIYLFKL